MFKSLVQNYSFLAKFLFHLQFEHLTQYLNVITAAQESRVDSVYFSSKKTWIRNNVIFSLGTWKLDVLFFPITTEIVYKVTFT